MSIKRTKNTLTFFPRQRKHRYGPGVYAYKKEGITEELQGTLLIWFRFLSFYPSLHYLKTNL